MPRTHVGDRASLQEHDVAAIALQTGVAPPRRDAGLNWGLIAGVLFCVIFWAFVLAAAFIV